MYKHHSKYHPFGSLPHETLPSARQVAGANAACPPGLLPRFAHYYTQLQALPRRVRRALERRYARPLASLALLLALGQAPALAATINVDGTTCTLVEAIRAANTDSVQGGCTAGSGDDTLVLGAGSTHTLTTVEDTTYGPTGLPLVTSTITIAGNNSSIERGAGASEFRLLAVAAGGNLTLQDLTLTGGLLVSGGTGGGVYNLGTLTLENSTVLGNTAFDDNGGGLFNRDGIITLKNSTVLGNFVFGSGGGLFNRDGTLTLKNSTVSGNFAFGSGGGLYNRDGTLTLENSTVSGNDGRRTGGGGLFNRGGTCTLKNSTVSGNFATGLGGGPAGLSNSGTLTIINSTVSGNTGGFGGGVSNGGTLTLTNSTVSGNTAEFVGIGGVSNSGTLTLARTLISGNTGPLGSEVVNFTSPPYGSGTVTANDFNLFGHNGNAGVSGFSPGPTDIIPEVPLGSILAPLANNGGPTLTQALVSGSPAVDAVGSGCPPPDTDQRGVSRPQPPGGKCDIGAFELQQAPPISIDSIIDFFDQAVSEGTLVGIGPGESGRQRLKALRNMLLAAGDYLEQGQTKEACDQLASALKRIDSDGVPKPNEFVTGPAAPTLAQMTRQLRDDLGCT